MRFGAEVYSLEFFKEKGYIRKKCEICGEYFWTVDRERGVCGESPCEEYRFVGRSLAKRKMNVRESRETFLRFFERRGHRIIKPYPVVARWRTDMFLTDASIVDFQHFVTAGIAPPPANPLVISQPCIRLVDIDKVGLTFGRHLTIFEMGGAHAFNYPDKEIYWKEGTVQYYHEYVMKEFGIPEEEIIYKESIWSGGGNAGPCFETISYGLELATLVFMQYKTVNRELIELPIKTVDTGYGIERFAWFTQGTPSSFDAIYGELYPRLEKLMNVPKPDPKLLERYSPYTALVVPKAGMTVAQARRRVAQASGIPIEVIEREIAPLEKIYAALDFTKSIAFIISEGVVPSNVRVGYLARLLIRKAYRLLESIGYADKLLDLIDLQLQYWGRDFPYLREMRDETLDIVGAEVEKFRETVRRGVGYVKRELKQMKGGVAEVPVEFMVRMYDERGLTPDVVAQVAEKLGMRADVPENFYELVASRHLRAEETPEEDWMKKLGEKVKGFPATRRTYYEKPLESRFRARVIGVVDDYVVLEETLFYPEGGGQVADMGVLRWDGGEARVVEVIMLEGGVIAHKLDGPVPKVGAVVEGEVDIERRLRIMRHHTATHILIGAARRVLGKHAWQAGAQKEPGKARLDIYHHRRLSRKDIERLEEEANRIIARRIPVKIRWMDRNEAERLYGFGLYQGGEVPSATIRVVEIPGWDAEACGGLHCENTEDVGIIKIIRTERIQDGVERLIYTAGPSALAYIQENERMIQEASKMLEVPVHQVKQRLKEVLEELKESRRTLRRLMTAAARLRAQEISEKPLELPGGLKLYVSKEREGGQEYALAVIDGLMEPGGPICALIAYGAERPRLVVIANEEAQAMGIHAGRLASEVASILGGKAGGKERLGQGGFEGEVGERELRETAQKIALKLLGKK